MLCLAEEAKGKTVNKSLSIDDGTPFSPTAGEPFYFYSGDTVNFGAFTSAPAVLVDAK